MNEKIEFAIEQFNKLDSILQSKVELLNQITKDSRDDEVIKRFQNKISGIKLAKEEIRRSIQDLKQLCQD